MTSLLHHYEFDTNRHIGTGDTPLSRVLAIEAKTDNPVTLERIEVFCDDQAGDATNAHLVCCISDGTLTDGNRLSNGILRQVGREDVKRSGSKLVFSIGEECQTILLISMNSSNSDFRGGVQTEVTNIHWVDVYGNQEDQDKLKEVTRKIELSL